jgi:hypothetical protein
VVPVEQVTQSILVLRGQKVLLDAELAALYRVSTARLNQQVRRNRERFPADFMFQLTDKEPAVSSLCLHRARRHHGGHRTRSPRSHPRLVVAAGVA